MKLYGVVRTTCLRDAFAWYNAGMKRLFALTVLVAWVARAEIPWPEHPRPDWERTEWVNLNGPWQFAFDKDGKGLAERWFQKRVGTGPGDLGTGPGRFVNLREP